MLETKIFKVGKKESIEMYLNDVYPGIILKWPEWLAQEGAHPADNVPAHPIVGKLGAKINARLEEMNACGWDIGFVHQRPSSTPFSHFNIKSAQRSLTLTRREAFVELPLDVYCKVWTTAQVVKNQIIIHIGNNDYKLRHVGKLQIEKAVGSNTSMRLPCWALIDGGALDCQYIATFMLKGNFIVALNANCRRRCCPSLSIAL